MLTLPHVLDCHLVSGDFDYLIKARIPDMSLYRQLLGDILLKLPCANESRSYGDGRSQGKPWNCR